MDVAGRPVEGRVTVREDASVRCHQPVAVAIGCCRHAHHRLVQMDVAGRPVEGRVTVGEDASVRCHQPVAVATRCGGHGHDRLIQCDVPGGAVERGVTVGEDASVGRHHPIASAVGGPGDVHDGPGQRQRVSRPIERRVPESINAAIVSGYPVSLSITSGGEPHGRAGQRGRRREPVRLEADGGGECIAGKRHVLIGAVEGHLGHPASEVTEPVPARDADRLKDTELRPGRVDGRHGDRGRPGVVWIAGARYADRVTGVHGAWEASRVGVATGRGRVLGCGNDASRCLHHLASGGRCRQVGDRTFVESATVGLTGEVARVGVAAVGHRRGHDIGTHRHGLGLQLLEAPCLGLWTGAADRCPSGGRFIGHDIGDVGLEGQRVDRPALACRVVDGLDGSSHTEVSTGLAELENIGGRVRVTETWRDARSHQRVAQPHGLDRPGTGT